jgi:hypothetical protein
LHHNKKVTERYMSMKKLCLAVALAAVMAMPAMAQDAKRGDKPDRPRHEMRKDMKDRPRLERSAVASPNKIAFDKLRDECRARIKSLNTPEQVKAARQDCKVKRDALREKLGMPKRDELKARHNVAGSPKAHAERPKLTDAQRKARMEERRAKMKDHPKKRAEKK